MLCGQVQSTAFILNSFWPVYQNAFWFFFIFFPQYWQFSLGSSPIGNKLCVSFWWKCVSWSLSKENKTHLTCDGYSKIETRQASKGQRQAHQLTPVILFLLSGLWSLLAEHIPRAYGSKWLWRLFWTQAVCFAHLLSVVPIRPVETSNQGVYWFYVPRFW